MWVWASDHPKLASAGTRRRRGGGCRDLGRCRRRRQRLISRVSGGTKPEPGRPGSCRRKGLLWVWARGTAGDTPVRHHRRQREGRRGRPSCGSPEERGAPLLSRSEWGFAAAAVGSEGTRRRSPITAGFGWIAGDGAATVSSGVRQERRRLPLPVEGAPGRTWGCHQEARGRQGMSQSTVDCGGSRGGRGAATRRLGDARGCRSLPFTVEGAEEDVGLPPGGSGTPGDVAVYR
ncbi:hypothetical protein MLD38_006717 [Melastoma candidum]|uniref:Uncharacterized protein n=1 Tax=Melastoma candidum TaxID=119954 RepID=A0ACB9RSJ9_9MYRT|nr:hypothetical protein MLD38_006717 [Melastoma candidum]